MKNMMFFVVNALLALSISTIPLRAQTPCNPDQEMRMTSLKRLAYQSPVTLDYHSGQTVRLSDSSSGNSLTGKVAIEAMPASVINHWQGDTESAPDVSAMMVDGNNTISMSGDEGKVFWLITESPCPQAPQPETTSVKTEPTQAVIAPQLDNESLPAITVEPASVVTPAPVPVDDGATMRRVLVFVLTLLVFLVRVVQLGWILAAALLLLAGLVFAYRRRKCIQAWITQQIRTIRKEVWHS